MLSKLMPRGAMQALRKQAIFLVGSRALSTSANGRSPRVLLTGCGGQIGTELTVMLREMHGADNIVASDVRKPTQALKEGKFMHLDVTNKDAVMKAVVDHDIDWVVHLAAMLSAAGERDPVTAMKINADGTVNVLEAARNHNLRVFVPSTIGAFGTTTPRDGPTADYTIQRPETMYGVTKVFGELLGDYYHNKFGVDFRCLRYPGVLSAETAPGGGTTDYAVEIFHDAVAGRAHQCFLLPDARLPMMYMPDCLRATIDFLHAPSDLLKQRVYNLQAVSFTPQEIYDELKKIVPDMSIEYKPDYRQNIAESWPQWLDDTNARKDWGWDHEYDLAKMTEAMYTSIKAQVDGSQ